MEINSELPYIKRAVTLAKNLGITDVIFEEGRVRAMDETQAIIILQDTDVPTFAFNSMGITKASLFLSRLALIEGRDKSSVSFTDGDGDGDVRALIMKAKGGKVEFRTNATSKLRAPKKINDNMTYQFTFTTDAMDILQRGAAAMPQNKEDAVVTFVGNNGTVDIHLNDKSNESFSWTIADSYQLNDPGATETFANRYPLAETIALFKRIGEDVTIQIGVPNGILKTSCSGFDVYILPRK